MPQVYSRRARTLAIGCLLASWICLAPASHGETLVLPRRLATTEGDFNNVAPFGITPSLSSSARYQQVFAAAEFGDRDSGPLWINQIAFRPDGFRGAAFSTVLPEVQVNLSTTQAAPDNLSSTYSINVGSDDTVVFPRGPLPISSTFAGPQSGPKDFDIVMNLATPFLYQPVLGNLLLDVRNFGAGTATPFDAVNAIGDSVSRLSAASLDSVNDTEGRLDTMGLVTRFTLASVPAVPEPGPWSFFAAAALVQLCLQTKRAPQLRS